MKSTPKLLLLHGGPGLKRDYLAGYFVKWRGDSVISFDYPEDAHVGRVLDFIQTSVPAGETFDVVAHSWGAFLLMELLKRDINWTSGRIVLVAPFPTSWEHFQKCGKAIDGLIRQRIAPDRIQRLETLVADQGGANDLEYIKIIEPAYVWNQKFSSQVGFTYCNRTLEESTYTSMRGFDHRDLVKRIKNRTMLILGNKDFLGIGNLSPWETLAEGIEVMEGIGHSPYLEANGPFFQNLDRFLANHSLDRPATR